LKKIVKKLQRESKKRYVRVGMMKTSSFAYSGLDVLFSRFFHGHLLITAFLSLLSYPIKGLN
jgi:hypothetical protein